MTLYVMRHTKKLGCSRTAAALSSLYLVFNAEKNLVLNPFRLTHFYLTSS